MTKYISTCQISQKNWNEILAHKARWARIIWYYACRILYTWQGLYMPMMPAKWENDHSSEHMRTWGSTWKVRPRKLSFLTRDFNFRNFQYHTHIVFNILPHIICTYQTFGITWRLLFAHLHEWLFSHGTTGYIDHIVWTCLIRRSNTKRYILPWSVILSANILFPQLFAWCL